MEFVEFCNLCQSQPATGLLTGYFDVQPDEMLTVQACADCARKTLKSGLYGSDVGTLPQKE